MEKQKLIYVESKAQFSPSEVSDKAIVFIKDTKEIWTHGVYFSCSGTWATPITLSLTGDTTGSVSIDGSGNVSIATTTNYLSGNTSITDVNNAANTQQHKIAYYARIGRDASNLFPVANNANAILSLNVHDYSYTHQLGFSSDGNIYHRRRSAGTWETSWKTILNSSNYTNFPHTFASLTNKPTTLSGYGITDCIPIISGGNVTTDTDLSTLGMATYGAKLSVSCGHEGHPSWLTIYSNLLMFRGTTDTYSGISTDFAKGYVTFIGGRNPETAANNVPNWWFRIKGSSGTTYDLNSIQNNINNLDSNYLRKSGGTMTGALNFANNTWNKVGDDAYMGDCNVAGMIGIKGSNAATPGFAMYNNSGTLLGKLYASGSDLYWSGVKLLTSIGSAQEAYLTWGGTNLASNSSPIDAILEPSLGANRLAFLSPDAIDIEYSQDGGTTWLNYNATDAQKVSLFCGGGNYSNFYLGGNSSTDPSIDRTPWRLRITISVIGYELYCQFIKFLIYTTDVGNTTYCLLQGRKYSDYQNNVDTWVTFQTAKIAGWSGWSTINHPNGITLPHTANYAQLRFEFYMTSQGTTGRASIISRIEGFAHKCWAWPSYMAGYGNIYSYDWQQNATFPAKVTATGGFSGNLTGNVTGNLIGNADTASKWKDARTITLTGDVTGSVSLDGSSNVTLTTTTSGTGTTAFLKCLDKRNSYPAQIVTSGGNIGAAFIHKSMLGGAEGVWYDAIILRGYVDNSAGNENALLFSKSSSSVYHSQYAFGSTTTWGTMYKFLDSNNYSSYALPLSGGTMTGNIILTTGSSYIADSSTSSSILGAFASGNTAEGLSSEAGVLVGKLATQVTIRSNGDDLWHYRNSDKKRYKILDAANYTNYTINYAKSALTNAGSVGVIDAGKLYYNSLLSFAMYAPDDNGGKISYELIAELPNYGTGTNTSYVDYGISGFIWSRRGGNCSNSSAYPITAIVSIGPSTNSKLRVPVTTHVLVPFIVKYNDIYYLALRKDNSGAYFYFMGQKYNLLTTTIKVNDSSLIKEIKGPETETSTAMYYYNNGTPQEYLHAGNYKNFYPIKLLYPRTLWGQSFDGTANVNGAINIVRDSSFVNNYTEGVRIQGTSAQWAGIFLGTDGTAAGYIASQWNLSKTASDTFRISRGATSTSLLEILNSGNVGIGTSSPTEKLQVSGSAVIEGNAIVGTASASSTNLFIKSSTAKLRLTSFTDSTTYIQSGNSDFTGNATLKITGYNNTTGSNLYFNFANIYCRGGSYTNIDSGNYSNYALKVDGSNGTSDGVSTLLNKLTTGSSTPTDADYYICQWAGGGTTTTSYHRRPMSALYTYVKSKVALDFLPLTGGTITDTLILKAGAFTASNGNSYSGGRYQAVAKPNMRLIGDSTYGLSTIEFISQKGDTSINKPSDSGFIQFQPYGVSALSSVGQHPTLKTSGETNALVLGVTNDSDDIIVLQSPNVAGLRHACGATEYYLPHITTSTTTANKPLVSTNVAHVYTLGAECLPLSGGTMTGTINCKAIVPITDNGYSIGTSSKTLYEIHANFFKRRGSSNDYVLLGGGEHKLISDFVQNYTAVVPGGSVGNNDSWTLILNNNYSTGWYNPCTMFYIRSHNFGCGILCFYHYWDTSQTSGYYDNSVWFFGAEHSAYSGTMGGTDRDINNFLKVYIDKDNDNLKIYYNRYNNQSIYIQELQFSQYQAGTLYPKGQIRASHFITNGAVTDLPITSSTFVNIPIQTTKNHTEDIKTTRSVYASAFYENSDIRLKENVHSIDQIDLLKNVDLVQFNFKNDQNKKYGVIAQQLEQVGLQNLVYENNGNKAVDYISLLVLEIQRLRNEIGELKQEINKKS